MRRTLIIGVLSAAAISTVGCTGRADKIQPSEDPTSTVEGPAGVGPGSAGAPPPTSVNGTGNPSTTIGNTGDIAPQPEPQPTYAHEWYVSNSGSDSNPGNSASAPFKTISKGVLAAGPGDRINVAVGVYRETVDIGPAAKEGTATAPILLQGSGLPQIVPAGTTWAMVQMRRKYWIVDGFDIDAELANHAGVTMFGDNTGSILRNNDIHSGHSPNGVDVFGGSNAVVIENNKIHDWDQGNVDAHGIAVLWESTNTTIRNNKIFHNSGDSIQCTGPEGETATGTETPADGLLIEGNDLSDDAENAVDLKTCWNVTVRNNYAHDYSRNGGTTFVVHMSAKNVLIENNVAERIGRGLSLGGNRVGPMPAGVVIRRNKFRDITIDSANLRDGSGIMVANSDHAVIANNTIVGNAGPTLILGDGTNGPTDGLTLENNIFDGSIIKIGSDALNLVSKTNLFLSNVQVQTPSGMKTLSQWQAMGGDVGSKQTAGPLADSSWQPASVAVNAGTAMGLPYCGAAPDIGAVETGCATGSGRRVAESHGKRPGFLKKVLSIFHRAR